MHTHSNSISFSIHRLLALKKTVQLKICKLEVQIYFETIPVDIRQLKNIEILSLSNLLITISASISELLKDGKHSVKEISKNKKLVEFTESYLEIFLLQDISIIKNVIPGETLLELWFRQSN